MVLLAVGVTVKTPCFVAAPPKVARRLATKRSKSTGATYTWVVSYCGATATSGVPAAQNPRLRNTADVTRSDLARRIGTLGQGLHSVGRNTNLDFGAAAGLTPHPESRPYASSPLVHSQQTPMSIPLRPHKLRVNPAAVVPHHHAQLAREVLNFNFDAARPGVAERVDHGFPPDQEDLFLDGRLQRPGLPRDKDPERQAARCEFVPPPGQRLFQSLGCDAGRVGPKYRRAAFIQGALRRRRTAVQRGLLGRVRRHLCHCGMQPRGGAKKTLAQR